MGTIRKNGGKSRMIRGILRMAHSHRLGHGGYWKIAMNLGTCARNFVSLAARAVEKRAWLVPGSIGCKYRKKMEGRTGRYTPLSFTT